MDATDEPRRPRPYDSRRRLALSIGLAVGALSLLWWLGVFAPAARPRQVPIPYAVGPDPSAEGPPFYQNDFERPPGTSYPEWSTTAASYAGRLGLPWGGTWRSEAPAVVEPPRGGQHFLGEFGGPPLDPTARTRVSQTVRLRLEHLPAHDRVTVRFDLLILKSWDGNSPRYGPDRWALKVQNGPTLIDTTFSNNPKVESEGSDQDFPTPGSSPQAGATAVRTLGYTFFGDSTYALRFTFPHQADTLTLDFSSELFEGKGVQDESWGLDNVRVSLGGPGPVSPRLP